MSPVVARGAQRGFTLFQLVVVITIVAVLAGTLTNRVLFYQEQAEKTAMVGVENAVQTALVLRYGHLLADGMAAQIPQLETENPMKWLSRPPANYVGEFYDPAPDAVARGNWAFDLKTHELVYAPYRAGHLASGEDSGKWIRYRVRLQRDAGPGGEEAGGVVFGPAVPYRWEV